MSLAEASETVEGKTVKKAMHGTLHWQYVLPCMTPSANKQVLQSQERMTSNESVRVVMGCALQWRFEVNSGSNHGCGR
jgi:hypothetical protein